MSGRSARCIKQDHNNCEGIIINPDDAHQITSICNCPCHNNLYQLVKRASIELNDNKK
ncbi:MAG TPA: hypothetical protein VFM31_03115 [Nitrososphaeraceae archaeon]|nr:hypothetical protein [Nitrososphaeraceae archaeon]